MTHGKETPTGGDWLDQVLRRYERPLIGHAMRLLGDEEAARDVAQDAFLALCRHPIELDDPRLGPWLHRVCHNRAIDRLRKERRMNRLDEPAAAPDPGSARSSPTLAAERQEDAGQLRVLVQALPPRQQEVVWLRFRSGLSYREIAEVTRTSTSNVGFLLHTALRRLRERLGEAGFASATGGES